MARLPQIPGMRRLPIAASVVAGLLSLAAAGAWAEPLGAYPPGMSGGRVPLGAYPPNRPPELPNPAGPPPAPPALADDRANYCLRNPTVCNLREPETYDYIIDRQKAFEQRMRDIEREIERSRTPR